MKQRNGANESETVLRHWSQRIVSIYDEYSLHFDFKKNDPCRACRVAFRQDSRLDQGAVHCDWKFMKSKALLKSFCASWLLARFGFC